MRKRHIFIALFIILLLLVFIWIPYRQKRFDPLDLPTGKVYSNHVTGNSQQVVDIPLYIDSKDIVINAAEIYLRFDPTKLYIESIHTEGSFFTLWITDPPKFSNTEGTIALAGGLPNPGHRGKGIVATIKAKIVRRGTQLLTFTDKSRVLLNDGKGTQQPLEMPPIRVIGR